MTDSLLLRSLACSGIGLLLTTTVWAADTPTPSMLANTCMGCHGPGGSSVGPATPTISGMSELYMIGAMLAYKYDNDPDKIEAVIDADAALEDVEILTRTSTVMGRIAKGYSDEEIKVLSKFYAEQPFVRHAQKVDPDKVKAGEKLHDKYCDKCHEDAGRSPEDDAGVLAGQWIPYLQYTMDDFVSGDREMPKKMRKEMKKMDKAHGDKAIPELVEFYAAQSK